MECSLTSQDFYKALKENRLLGLRCKECGAHTLPAIDICGECTSQDVEVAELSGNGTIISYTVIHIPPMGFEGPYVVGLIELDEGPRVFGTLVDVDPCNVPADILDKRVKIGHRAFEGDIFSAGKRVALVFNLED